MNANGTAALLVALAAAPALAHGGGYVGPTIGGSSGPQAPPGLRDPETLTRWETWWADNREDLLRITERVDSTKGLVVTPSPADGGKAPDAASRRRILAAAVREDVLPQLLWALREDDFDIRGSAAIALGKLGDARAAAPLKACARHDERAEVRRAAILGLGLLGRGEEVPFLCELVADRKAEIDERAMAAVAAGLVGGDDAASFLSFLVEGNAAHSGLKRTEEVQLVATLHASLGLTDSPEALRTLWRAADDEALDPFLRAHAVLSLGRLRDRESAGRFAALCAAGNDVQLRRAAVVALGLVIRPGDAESVRVLTGLLRDDKDVRIRSVAIASLAEDRDPPVRAFLRAQFDGASPDEKPLIALTLAVQGDVASAPAIRAALLAERDPKSRGAYATALGLLGDRDAIPPLEREVADAVSRETQAGLAALALAVIPSAGSRETIWRRMVADKDGRIWGDCATALGMLDDSRVRPWLEKRLKNGDGNYDKCRAAACLGALRRADSLPVLAETLHDRYAPGIVRALCVVAMGQIADPSVVPKLARIGAGGGATLATRVLAEAMSIL